MKIGEKHVYEKVDTRSFQTPNCTSKYQKQSVQKLIHKAPKHQIVQVNTKT